MSTISVYFCNVIDGYEIHIHHYQGWLQGRGNTAVYGQNCARVDEFTHHRQVYQAINNPVCLYDLYAVQ